MREERRDFGAVEHGAESAVGDKDDDAIECSKVIVWMVDKLTYGVTIKCSLATNGSKMHNKGT